MAGKKKQARPFANVSARKAKKMLREKDRWTKKQKQALRIRAAGK